MSEHLQMLLTLLGICGSTGWAMFGFMMKHTEKNNLEMREWFKEQLEHYESKRKVSSEVWREMLRVMQATDRKLEVRVDELDEKVHTINDCMSQCRDKSPDAYP